MEEYSFEKEQELMNLENINVLPVYNRLEWWRFSKEFREKLNQDYWEQYDKAANLVKAECLADTLGYAQGYYGNLGYNIARYEEEMIQAITNLVGENWPNEVKAYHESGYLEGWWES